MEMVTQLSGQIVIGLFSLIGVMHLYWAIGGKVGLQSAIPQRGDQALFRVTFGITMLIGGMLLCFAWVVAAFMGLVLWDVPQDGLRAGVMVILALFLARMVGDFNYLGLFKKVKGTKFARLDDLVYSPLCGVIALLLALQLRYGGG